jgi:hypothetical protein
MGSSDLGSRAPLPLSKTVERFLTSAAGVPYLAPELQLLFKSKDVLAKDNLDARQVIPGLEADRRRRLARWLPSDHRWQELLVEGR